MASVIRYGKVILKASPLSGENPQPFFRQPDIAVAAGPDFPQDKHYSFGRETGFRVLPYTMQDRYSRKLEDMEFSSVVMENEYIKAEFIPALGGRLWSLFDKKRNRDMIYRNPVFRPANLAIRDAWFSGGIEWNIGRLGHTVHSCSPVFAGVFEADGTAVLRLWEFERQTRLFWRIEFTLAEDSCVLFAYTRIENPDSTAKPLYWWTNTALPQTPLARVFSAADEVIYIVPGTGAVKTMGYGRLPELPVLAGRDASYPALSDYSNEYFFQNDRGNSPWESVVYEDGYAWGERSTLPLRYRKMFCWGNGPGGRRWQDFLSLPGQEYLEVQAGLAPTQLHTADIGGREVADWVQAFTAFQAETEQTHQKDYLSASRYVDTRLTHYLEPDTVQAALEQARSCCGTEAEILETGSGWGYLESRLRKYTIPSGLSFPIESAGATEAPWAELLLRGSLPRIAVEAGPGSFAIDEAWENLLEACFHKTLEPNPTGEGDWFSPYHLGVIAFERGETGRAVSWWEESLKREKNPWACRNLAVAALQSGDTQTALNYYEQALSLPGGQDQSFIQEYVPLLMDAGREEEAAALLETCIRRAGSLEALALPLIEAAARIALNRGDVASGDTSSLDRIFSLEPVHIREGNTVLVDIWTEREIRRLTEKGISRNEAEMWVRTALAEGSLVPPKEIDFRMYTSGTRNNE
ncbi:MAG: DUF5107 domain-containing protein [Treponema sp.]|nr:DUF5107 domain-containing protein [Treponema sp.]